MQQSRAFAPISCKTFRAQLSQILDLRHPLLRLSEKMDWARSEAEIDGQYRPGPGQPPLLTRLMAGLYYLKYAFDGYAT